MTLRQLAERLYAFVAINEDIRKVSLMAFEINLMGLNALLLSSRSGSAAQGFGVASGELSHLAVQLAQQMDDVQALSHSLVDALTQQIKLRRYGGLLAQTMEEEAATERALGHIRSGMQERNRQLAARCGSLRGEVEASIRKSCKDCAYGLALARAARIEAAWSGAAEAMLGQVADQFQGHIESITPLLNKILSSPALTE